MHAKPSPPKILHFSTETYSALSWITPHFEVYALATRGTPRHALAEAASKIVQFVRKEEERIFIIGGAVF
jgi:hypothetical protein